MLQLDLKYLISISIKIKVHFKVMKTASIMGIFLINVFMSKKWPGVGPDIGRHPAFGGGPDRTHPAWGGRWNS